MPLPKSLRQMAPDKGQVRRFTLPPLPRIPESMVRRFSEMGAYQAEMDQWHAQAQQAITDFIESSQNQE